MDFTYEKGILENITDAKELRRHLTELGKVITDPTFPHSETVGKETKLFLSDLLSAVSKAGALEEVYNEILDLALDLTVKKVGCDGTRPHFDAIGYSFYNIEPQSVKGKGKLFEGLVKKFSHVLDHVKDKTYLTLRFARPVVYACLSPAMGTSKEHVELWIAMIKSLLRHHTSQCLEAAYNALQEKDNLLKWKQYSSHVKELFQLLSNFTLPDWLTDTERKACYECYNNVVVKLLGGFETAKLVGEITGDMVHSALDIMESRTPELFAAGKEIANKISFNIKKDKALIMETVRRITAALADDSYGWNGHGNYWNLNGLAQDLFAKALGCVNDGRAFTWEEFDELIALVKFCQQADSIHPETGIAGSVTYIVLCQVGFKVINWLKTMNEIQRVAPLVPGVLDMLTSYDDNIRSISGAMMTIISLSGDLFAPYIDKMIKMFLDSEDSSLLGSVVYSYEYNPQPLAEHFQALFDYLDSGNSSVRAHMLQLILKVAKHQPDLLTKDNIMVLMKEAREDSANQTLLLMIMEEIIKKRPDKLAPHLNELMNLSLWQPLSVFAINRMLQFYALKLEADIPEIINFMIKQVQTCDDKTAGLTAFNAMRLIGYKHRAAIEKHRPTIEKIKKETKDEDYRTLCGQILDMLDGRSVDKIVDELKALQVEVADIDIRVNDNEKAVTEVKDTVKRQGQDIDIVKKDVADQGQRLDQVEETVEDTVIKVEEIDGKTLSHAPFWSRDVAKLLNPEAEHDWRLLSSRLGYSNDDIRSWAQQHDPCMAMLNEWYATHKTREATFAVLTALQDISRLDVAVIVENAMKNAEAVVEDEEFEYAKPPDIFLSYQWGHQSEVRLLRQHLEMAGYSCWMDVGQMGGGDKLFEKIDSGIRGAKVVISCVTEKYAKSPNCNREVNLSVSLGKAIIPLLMEKTTWPPPGSMGPIFSEYLFVRFFQRDKEQTKDQRYWPLDKFQELLMQLSMNGVTPDEAAVQPEYKNWWIPKIEEVTVDKNRSKKGKTQSVPVPAATSEKLSASPDVFISYQWGRQPQIVQLYRSLTALGYTCWLDIMQMGGGDSLYDKIDRGLRGCRVVLSCVTPKYALSANCRREVSLADALHKPIIPLLLETASWPPPGPMGPILTQLLYIDCTGDPSVQEKWQGSKFDEIVAKIDQHITPLTTTVVQSQVNPQVKDLPPKVASGDPAAGAPPKSSPAQTAPPNREGLKGKGDKQSQDHLGEKDNNNVARTTSETSLSSKNGHEGHNVSNNRGAMPKMAQANTSSGCCVIF